MAKTRFNTARLKDVEDAIILEEHVGPLKDIPETMYHQASDQSIFTQDGRQNALNIAGGHARNVKSRATSLFQAASELTKDVLAQVEIDVPIGRRKSYLVGFDRNNEDGHLEFYYERGF